MHVPVQGASARNPLGDQLWRADAGKLADRRPLHCGERAQLPTCVADVCFHVHSPSNYSWSPNRALIATVTDTLCRTKERALDPLSAPSLNSPWPHAVRYVDGG